MTWHNFIFINLSVRVRVLLIEKLMGLKCTIRHKFNDNLIKNDATPPITSGAIILDMIWECLNLLYDIKSRIWRIYLITLNLSHIIDLIIKKIGWGKLNIWGNSYIYFFTLHKSIMFKYTIWHKFENVTAIFNSII